MHLSRNAEQPITEEQLLTGPLEPTNEWYAIAKIAGIKLCQAYRKQYGCDFISAMPTNLYGPGDNFDLDSSHVLPALMRKFHDSIGEADPEVTVWGTGSPMREFLHVDDLADACLFLMENYSDDAHINVGTGVDLSIRELAEKIRDLVNPKQSWCSTAPSPTARRARCSTSAACKPGLVAHLRPRRRHPQHLRLVRRRTSRRRRTARHRHGAVVATSPVALITGITDQDRCTRTEGSRCRPLDCSNGDRS